MPRQKKGSGNFVSSLASSLYSFIEQHPTISAALLGALGAAAIYPFITDDTHLQQSRRDERARREAEERQNEEDTRDVLEEFNREREAQQQPERMNTRSRGYRPPPAPAQVS